MLQSDQQTSLLVSFSFYRRREPLPLKVCRIGRLRCILAKDLHNLNQTVTDRSGIFIIKRMTSYTVGIDRHAAWANLSRTRIANSPLGLAYYASPSRLRLSSLVSYTRSKEPELEAEMARAGVRSTAYRAPYQLGV